MVRDLAVSVAVVALGGAAAWLMTGCGGGGSTPGSTTRSGQNAQSQDRAVAAARSFLHRYVARDGRVVRIDQGGDTVGEGQAYGMLLAAAIGDSRTFDTIWAWTQKNLVRPDGLISFLWRDGHVVDPEAASDADLDASRALLVAACRFNRPAFRQQAIHLGNAILAKEVATGRGDPVLTAGPWAISPTITLNPSYFSPAAFTALGVASHDPRWAGLAATSRTITSELMSGPRRLPPDWAALEGGKPVPIGSPSDPQARPEFSFDAVRTLVRAAEASDPVDRSLAAKAWPVFARQDPTSLPVQHELSGRPIGHVLHPVVLVSAAAAADAAGQTANREGLLAEAEALDRRSPTYYGAAWVALGRIMLTTHLLETCS